MEFSIIIPLYNKAKHIERTISTVLAQTYGDFELIVIDDGSTDESADIVSRINDSRIKLVSKSNEGVSVTRNKGVSMANNDLIAFLDADDEWEPNYLESIVCLVKEYPEAGIFATNYRVVERNGATYSLEYPQIPKSGQQGLIENYFDSAIEYTPLWTSAVCVNKRVFQEMGGFPTEIKNGEDLDLWCRIALKYQIAYVNLPLATYRRDSENMLSRSIVDPCWFPFLDNYSPSSSDIVNNSDSVNKYITIRQLEAASATLFVLKDRKRCNKILRKIRNIKWNRKKYIGLFILQLLPQKAINYIYKKRNITVYE